MKSEMKIVGRRTRTVVTPETANQWLHTIRELSGDRPICPRGVYRFKSFEEADQWLMRMLVTSILETRR